MYYVCRLSTRCHHHRLVDGVGGNHSTLLYHDSPWTRSRKLHAGRRVRPTPQCPGSVSWIVCGIQGSHHGTLNCHDCRPRAGSRIRQRGERVVDGAWDPREPHGTLNCHDCPCSRPRAGSRIRQPGERVVDGAWDPREPHGTLKCLDCPCSHPRELAFRQAYPPAMRACGGWCVEFLPLTELYSSRICSKCYI